jgi:hypothetical protein
MDVHFSSVLSLSRRPFFFGIEGLSTHLRIVFGVTPSLSAIGFNSFE